MHFPATALDQRASEPRPRTLRPHRGFQACPPDCLGSLRHTWPHRTWACERTPTFHQAIRPLPGHHSYRPTSPSLGIHSHRAATLPTGSHPLVDVGVHSNERVMSPAPGVGSHTSVVCLRTRVSSGNQPMFDTKSRKCCTPLEGPAGTEYLEDATLEQHGKVQGSRRSPGR